MSASEKQYPPQTGLYKVKVKSKTSNMVHDNGVLRLEISVGQPYHEGEKFRCTIDWAKHRYGKVIVLVNDSLQRFNYMFEEGLSEKDAHSKALSEGTQWIARNMAAIASLPNFEIYRWDAWKRSQGYFSDLQKTKILYEQNPQFKQAINKSIEDIWQRKNIDADRKDKFFSVSRDYLLEETAAFSVIYKTFKGVSAYPGSFQAMWEMFINEDIFDAPEGLKFAHCLRIDFDKRDDKANSI